MRMNRCLVQPLLLMEADSFLACLFSLALFNNAPTPWVSARSALAESFRLNPSLKGLFRKMTSVGRQDASSTACFRDWLWAWKRGGGSQEGLGRRWGLCCLERTPSKCAAWVAWVGL